MKPAGILSGVASMESGVMPPHLIFRRRMRNAWIALGVFVLACFSLSACFEWLEYRDGYVLHFLFFEGVAYSIIFLASLVAAIRMAIKRAFKPMLVYAVIVGIAFVIMSSPYHNRRLALSMEMKARIFAAYPQLCPTPPLPNQRVSVCYILIVAEVGAERAQIIFNPGNEMSLPAKQWPDDIKNMFTPYWRVQEEIFQCLTRKTKRIVDDVYVASDDCDHL